MAFALELHANELVLEQVLLLLHAYSINALLGLPEGLFLLSVHPIRRFLEIKFDLFLAPWGDKVEIIELLGVRVVPVVYELPFLPLVQVGAFLEADDAL